jgi:guanylate kinase
VLEIDIEGVKQMRQKSIIDARYIFIKPPSFEELAARLQRRSTETEMSIKKRMQQAKAELQQAETLGLYDKIIVNENLATAYKELESFICG